MSLSNKFIGEVTGVYREIPTATFEWTIPHFFLLEQGVHFSPKVRYFNMDWQISILNSRNGIPCVSLFREHFPPGVPQSVHFTLRCKTSEGEERDVARDKRFSEERNIRAMNIYPPCRITSITCRVTIICSLQTDDSPRIPGVSRETQTEDTGFRGVSRETQTEVAHCRNDENHSKGVYLERQTEDAYCRYSEPHAEGVSLQRQTEDAYGRYSEPHAEGISLLSDYFRNLLLSGDHHDLLIKVKDKEFRAHKCVLRIRCPVFAAMFGSEMADGAESSVTIDDCEPDAFGEFLHYVYTGEVDIASASSALGLYHAGDKFGFPKLKGLCVEFLKNSFTTTTVFRAIHWAARRNEEELLQRAVFYFSTHLEEVLLNVEWQRFLSANPIQANEMYFKAVQCLKTSLRKK